MNILLIGNGFDLAHNLPTKYGDFLDFCKRVKCIFTYDITKSLDFYSERNINNWDINDEIKEVLKEAYISRKKDDKQNQNGSYIEVYKTNNEALNQMFLLLEDNAWLDYFLNCSSYIGENWIDFEQEISKVIQALDELRVSTVNEKDTDSLLRVKQKVLVEIVKKAKGNISDILGGVEKIDTFTLKLYNDLKKIIRALELYLSEFVNNIENSTIISEISELSVDHVLSFNYTDTYEKIYGSGKEIHYNFIHGKAFSSNTINSNNMVLGIDEYLSNERKNKETYFISFKKYYQRILKSTGCDYLNWIEMINNDFEVAYTKAQKYGSVGVNLKKLKRSDFNCHSNLYIFGHSLDITDGDILRTLICNDNIHTKVYYYRETEDDKRILEKLIANLVKIIGQDELIKRTGGVFKTIEFIPQSI